jgi:uncharacterized lipoprotein YajG
MWKVDAAFPSRSQSAACWTIWETLIKLSRASGSETTHLQQPKRTIEEHQMMAVALQTRLGVIFTIVLALALGGCASPYTPSPDRPLEPITEFTSQQMLSIVNAQESTADVTSGPFVANRRAWTDVAIQIAERELKARGVRIAPSAQRSLRLAVTDFRYNVGFVTLETSIDMRVDTGGGYTATYSGKNSAVMAANPRQLVDGAMMRVVAEMLKDPNVVRYLTQ